MSVADALLHVGGVATRGTLVAMTSRREVDHALAIGEISIVARGRYALQGVDKARLAAHCATAVLSHASAALCHGWAVALQPEQPHVIVSKHRKLTPAQVGGLVVHRAELGPDDVVDGVTSQERTLVDCLRTCSPPDALAVADSALRSGWTRDRLLAVARDARGPGSVRVRSVAEQADGRAANGFESALREIASRVQGLAVEPQVSLRTGNVFLGRPDLVDERLCIVLEADSFEWHGDRGALTRDAQRYNRLAVHGWLVLRFTWEDVMFHPAEVKVVLEAAVAERTQRRCGCGSAA